MTSDIPWSDSSLIGKSCTAIAQSADQKSAGRDSVMLTSMQRRLSCFSLLNSYRGSCYTPETHRCLFSYLQPPHKLYSSRAFIFGSRGGCPRTKLLSSPKYVHPIMFYRVVDFHFHHKAFKLHRKESCSQKWNKKVMSKDAISIYQNYFLSGKVENK